jgi:hypothetical protein
MQKVSERRNLRILVNGELNTQPEAVMIFEQNATPKSNRSEGQCTSHDATRRRKKQVKKTKAHQ